MLKVGVQKIYQKTSEVYHHSNGKTTPLLLFVSYGYDEEHKMRFVRINGIRNPLPFKTAWGISGVFLNSWLKSMGWEEVGHSVICYD